MREGGLGCLAGRGREKIKGEVGKVLLPVGECGEVVEFGVGEVVCTAGFGGGSGGEEGDFSGGKGEVWELKGAGGNGGDVARVGERVRGDAEVSTKALVGEVLLEVSFKELLSKGFKIRVLMLLGFDELLHGLGNRAVAVVVLA